jgi:hypothetical protein
MRAGYVTETKALTYTLLHYCRCHAGLVFDARMLILGQEDKYMRVIASIVFLTSVLSAQTKLDLRTQTNPATKPVKIGTLLPATCFAGDLFLKTTAPSGANLYGCLATNIWTLQASGGTGTSLTIQADGTVVGTEPVTNFVGGTGILKAISDTGSRIDILNTVDTAVVQTHTNEQSGRDLFCESASASATQYSCSLSPSLTALTKGMELNWKPDVNSAGNASTLSIDALGPIAIKLPDGASDPAAGDLQAGRLTQLWYDGSVFRMVSAQSPIVGAGRPSCAAATQSRIWFTPGTAGLKDELAVCAKDAANLFAWRVVY